MRKLRHRASKAPAFDGKGPAAAVQYVNAPAERCSVHRGSLGHRFVRYQGRDYIVTGLYYEPRPWKKPRAFFVLRLVHADARAPVPARSGAHRKVRRGHALRAGLYAVIIITLLTMPAWIGSKPRALDPPAAQRVAPETVPGVPDGSHEASSSRSTPQRARAVESHPTLAVVTRSGRLRMNRPSRRLLYDGTRNRGVMNTFYAVSFGMFRDGRQAGEVARRIRAKGYPATVTPAGVSVRVRGHRYRTRANAAHMVKILRSLGLPASVEAVNAG